MKGLASKSLIVIAAALLCGVAGARADILYISYSNNDNYVEVYSSSGTSGVNTDLGVMANSTTDTATPDGMAFDSKGNLYVANDGNNNITEFAPNGNYLGVYASGLFQPAAMAFDKQGNLYVVNVGDGEILKIGPGGAPTTVFASGFYSPQGLAFGPNGNLYMTEQLTNSIKEITPSGKVSTFYQDGSWTIVNQLEGLAFDTSGNLYVASNRTNSVEKITPAGVATLFASNPSPASDPNDPNNPSDPEGIFNPIGLAFDSSGDLFVMNFHHTQVPGEPYEGHGISYIDELSSQGVMINEFTGNLSLPGSDPNLRDENYIAIKTNAGVPVPLPPGDSLQVSATSALNSSGGAGGPFAPGSDTYALSNAGTSSLGWTASATQSWLSLSAPSGTLAPGGSGTVTASINANASLLAPGSYSDTVTITDLSSGVAQTEAVSLNVIAAPVITSPLTAAATSGVAFSYQITATNGPTGFAASGLPAGLSVNATTGIISGTATATGTSNVIISAANAVGGAGNAILVLTVGAPAPVINSALVATATCGAAFSYQITASNSPTGFAASGLPSGLSVNTATGLISGTPTATGASNVMLSATNSVGSGSAMLVLTVQPPPPVISSALVATATAGAGFSYQIAARNSPASFAASGLPSGLSVNTATGLISGTATAAGTSSVTITAANVSGSGSATLALTVLQPPPAINSLLAVATIAGSPFSYQITASNSPASFGASGLPAGLSVNTSTGLISGTATAPGVSNVTISAANASGTGSATLVLTCEASGILSETLYVTYSNNDNYVEEFSSTGTSGVNTDLGPMPYTTTDTATPNGIAFDSQGNLYVANDANNNITKFAPNGSYLGVYASALNQPAAIVFDGQGNLYVVNVGTGAVLKIAPGGGTPKVLAGGFNSPQGIAMGPNGNLYVSDQGSNSVKEITPAGQVSTFYQDGSYTVVNQVEGLAFDASGNLYLASYRTNSIEKITPAGVATVFASNPSPASDPNDANNPSNPEGVFNPLGLAFDSSGDLFVANYHHAVIGSVMVSYIDEFSPAGALINAFANNPTLPGGDQSLRDPNYIAIKGSAGTASPEELQVSSSSAFASSGAAGGPFAPGSDGYGVANGGSASLAWTASANQSWLTLSATSGTLGAGGSTTVGASINANASALAAGSYSGAIIFTDTGTGYAQTEPVSLTVYPPPVIGGVLTATATNGAAFSYQIAASNGPVSFGASGLPAGLSINTATGLISGATTATGTDDVTISAANASGGAGSATLVLTVLPPAPAITPPLVATATTGVAFSYQIAASNSPTSFGASGLPAGLSVNTATGLISGTATATGISDVTISAANAGGSGSATLVLTVLPPAPAIGSPLTATATCGAAFSYQIIGTNSPTSFGASGLPAGLSVNTATGLISGTATATGTSDVTISAANVSGTGNATLVLIILPPAPVISSPLTAAAICGTAFSYQIAGTHNPTSFGASGLPAGLSVNTATGLISGTATATGTSNVSISAGNAGGSGSATLVLTVLPQAPVITSVLTATATSGAAFSYQIAGAHNPTGFGASGLPAGLSVNPVAGVISGTATAAGMSSVTIVASNAGGSGTATLLLTVQPPPPVITSPLAAVTTSGTAFSYQIAATNNPASFGASGLPAGLSVDPVAGLISGTATATGTSNVIISAANVSGTGSATLVLVVLAQPPPPPVISSPLTATAVSGAAFSYQIAGSNSPTSFSASGLPAGLSVDPVAGLISGTATVTGASNVTIVAGNVGGSGSATLVLTVLPPAPVISSPLTATAVCGAAFSYQIAGTNNPTSFSANGLPSGLSVNTATGLVSGTATATGTSNVTIGAASASGSGIAKLVLSVLPPPPVISSPLTATAVSGAAFIYQIAGANNPTSFGANGLPSGLSVNTATGLVTGTATATGTSNVVISAASASGSGSAMLVLTVLPPPPVISSALNATAVTGTYFGYQIVATNSPTSFSATGLPAGLGVNAATGLISGTATATGVSNVTISAANASGTGSATLVLASVVAGAQSETLYIAYSNNDNYVEEFSSSGTSGVNVDLGPMPYTTTDTATPNGIAFDSQGNLYVVNDGNNNITEFAPNGSYLGVYVSGLNQPAAIAFDRYNNLYVVNVGNGELLRVPAGGGTPAVFASGFNSPQGVAVGPNGNIYVTDQGSNSVKEITPQGQVSTFYQDGSYTVVNQLEGMAFDASGNLYVASYRTNSIEEISPAGVATLFAGNPSPPSDPNDPNNPSNPEGIFNPIGITFDSSGDLFVANYHHTQVAGEPYEGHGISYIDEYSSSGVLISAFTGNTALPGADPNLRDANYIAIYTGGGVSTAAPENLRVSATAALAASGGVGGPFATGSDSYGVANAGSTPLAWSAGATQSWLSLSATSGTLAASGSTTVTASINANANALGSGTYTDTVIFTDLGTGYTQTEPVSLVVIASPAITSPLAATAISGDSFSYQILASNSPASFGASGLPAGLTVNSSTGLISGTATVTGTTDVTISATNAIGASGSATLVLTCQAPASVGPGSTLFVTYSNNDNYVEEFSSSGTSGIDTDLGPMPYTTTDTTNPNGIAFDGNGNLYVADDGNNTITKFGPTGSYLGVYASGLYQPAAIAFDSSGNLYVVNVGNGLLLKIPPGGGTPVAFARGFNSPQGVAIGPNGNIYVSDQGSNSIKEVTPAGQVSTFYSDGSYTIMNQVEGLAFDASGNLYVASYRTNSIEEISPTGVPTLFASNPSPASDPNDPNNPSNPAGIFNPIGLAFDSSGDLFVANYHHAEIGNIAVSYIDEYSATGTLITAFTNNPTLPGSDQNLRDPNYIAIRPSAGASSQQSVTAAAASVMMESLAEPAPSAAATDMLAETETGAGATAQASADAASSEKILAKDGAGSDKFFLMSLPEPGGAGTRDLVLEATVNGASHVIASEGESVAIGGGTRTVSTLTTLVGSPGTLADGRWRVDESNLGMRVTFADGSEAIYVVPAAATSSTSWTLAAETGAIDNIPGLNGAVAVSFGLPAFKGGTEAHVVNLAAGTGGITAANDAALTSGTILLAQKGSEAPDASGAAMTQVFSAFSDPVAGANGAVAFEARLSGSGGTGLWFAADGVTPRLVAITGGAAPGSGYFAKFISMVLPAYPSGSGGPIFTAALSLSPADGVTGANNVGLWAVDGTGTLQLLFRSGQSVTVNGKSKTVRRFTALEPAPRAPGTAHGYDNQGNVSVVAYFTDGARAVLNIPAQ